MKILVTLAVEIEVPADAALPESLADAVASSVATRVRVMRAFVPGRPLSKDPHEPFIIRGVEAVSGVEVDP